MFPCEISLKAGKVVVLLQGRYAGRKAVIVRNFDDGNKSRKYGHAVVAGIDRYPRKILKRMSKRKMAMRSRIKPFVKLVNYSHVMPTRYGVDVDLKALVTPQVLTDPTKKMAVANKVKKLFEKRFV